MASGGMDWTEEDLFKCARGVDGYEVKGMREAYLGNCTITIVDDKDNSTLLHDACIAQNEDVVRFLLTELDPSYIDQLIHAKNNEGRTPLHKAVQYTKLSNPREEDDIIKLLIRARADVDAKDNGGLTPFDKRLTKRTVYCDTLCSLQ
mmetsp:Transcript_25121/g.46893  ORF Transcript_25121/g.46893 Transcript_25121/m.46893 type:complete len:148 (-) Transcript_25121:127-570(-)